MSLYLKAEKVGKEMPEMINFEMLLRHQRCIFFATNFTGDYYHMVLFGLCASHEYTGYFFLQTRVQHWRPKVMFASFIEYNCEEYFF